MRLNMDTDIRYLKGVGEKRAALYKKLNIKTIRGLLYHFPRDYLDLSRPFSIQEASPFENCAVKARLIRKGREQRIRKGLSLYRLEAEDDTGRMIVTMYNTRFTVDALELDEEYIFYGKVVGSLLRREMSSPAIYPANQPHTILPIYPQTAGISSKLIRKNIEQALELLEEQPEHLPPLVMEKCQLLEISQALKMVHFPNNVSMAKRARERFILEELLVLSLALTTLQDDRAVERIEPMRRVIMDPFWDNLPFRPTGAQARCIEESLVDFCGEIPMNRLIQGDVGSGKTLVVAACAYFATQNGVQSAVMVPTEILAEQHFLTLGNMLEPLGIRCALLTGSTKASEKRRICDALSLGQIDLCIGTHALLSQGVQFKNLRFVVTDEQHRFGVAQRAALSQKSEGCHVMVLSATPIPRTLSLIIYGDLRLSVIDELPPGRQPIETFVIGGDKRARALNFVKKALNQGRQAYIVCPLIQQGEIDSGLRPAVEYAEQLASRDLKEYRVGLLHGKMKQAEKDSVMRRFKSGEIHALVSTTVVEVGVDVPNATIIMIENAERFGLSQLHQLRGRVGRGREKSYCILISDARGETTRERLQVMKQTNDGFVVAEHDLKLRGPGDFFGFRQHGLPSLVIADLAEDMAVMQLAQECAHQILADDPRLEQPEHADLAKLTAEMIHAVGDRPN